MKTYKEILESIEVYTEEEIALFELDDEMFEKALKKKSAGERMKKSKERAKWAKTVGGKKSAKKAKKRAKKVASGSIKVDKKRSKLASKVGRLYN